MKILIKGVKRRVKYEKYPCVERCCGLRREMYYELSSSFSVGNAIFGYWDSLHVFLPLERSFSCLAHIEYY